MHAGAICRWPVLLVGSSHCAMIGLSPCVELQRLQQQYQTALRIWGQFEFQLHNEPVGPQARQAEQLQLKQRALNARNEAISAASCSVSRIEVIALVRVCIEHVLVSVVDRITS